MRSSVSTATISRAFAAGTVLGVFAVFRYYLAQPGYDRGRLVLFALIAGATLLAGLGVGTRRPAVTIAGVVGLALLGFWQFVVGIFVYLAIGCFLLALLVDHAAYRSSTRPSSDSSS
ncbi:hypothetical protein D8Y22_15550 [Salinadaptatus halalkaliphilus]|uniref:Uncharacterized protein n=1 Tax=Salinadaptatus halalkaliphilus TaxID=2419781 RepID=A0A4S3TIB7_9EURY|nr:hypothetical protein [Salinadaptatus halalkaliphilus]THE63759.1 hypothetical protein D8Y22_15550 [Salinadaptatus halalkaliphilus]